MELLLYIAKVKNSTIMSSGFVRVTQALCFGCILLPAFCYCVFYWGSRTGTILKVSWVHKQATFAFVNNAWNSYFLKIKFINERILKPCRIIITYLLMGCAIKSLMAVVSCNKLHTYFRRRSYADCAINIVCIFGLTGEDFLYKLLVGCYFVGQLILKDKQLYLPLKYKTTKLCLELILLSSTQWLM